MDLSSMPRHSLEEYARNLDAALERCEQYGAAYRRMLLEVAGDAAKAVGWLSALEQIARRAATEEQEQVT